MDSSLNAAILLVEDHQDLAATVGMFLENEGFQVEYAADGVLAYELASQMEYDAIVLDVMLPKLSGIEVCERLRNNAGVDTPILMLTARDQLDDKMIGFEAGADDYLIKPFDLPELSVRLKAMIKRSRGCIIQSVLQVGDLTFNEKSMEVQRSGQLIRLTPVGLKILKILMRASPGIVRRKELVREVWGDDIPDTDALRSHLYQLRRSIDKPFDIPLIQTVAGVGFKIIA